MYVSHTNDTRISRRKTNEAALRTCVRVTGPRFFTENNGRNRHKRCKFLRTWKYVSYLLLIKKINGNSSTLENERESCPSGFPKSRGSKRRMLAHGRLAISKNIQQEKSLLKKSRYLAKWNFDQRAICSTAQKALRLKYCCCRNPIDVTTEVFNHCDLKTVRFFAKILFGSHGTMVEHWLCNLVTGVQIQLPPK